MTALRRRSDTGTILSEVRQLEKRLAHTRDRATINKLIDRIDRLTARGLDAERRSERLVEQDRPASVPPGVLPPHVRMRRPTCLHLVKR